MTAANIAVQIVNYKTRAYLEQCLRSVAEDLAGSDLTYCVNVLESASGDDLAEIVAGYPHARLFESDVNGGFGAGHNVLASHTDASHLLILNPDVKFIEPRTSARLIQTLRDNPGASAVGPKLVDAEDSRSDGITVACKASERRSRCAVVTATGGRAIAGSRSLGCPGR